MVKTLYSVLGVEPSADQSEIDEAFNRLKLQYPKDKVDANEDMRIRFLALQQAYATLSNPDTRAAYDQKLAKAGIRTSTPDYALDDSPARFLSTRNMIVAGMILILISGMWIYHARQKAREEREVVERVLRLAEEEKRREAELRGSEEERRRAMFERSQEQRLSQEERRTRLENERFARQASMEAQNAERRASYEQQNAERKAEAQRMQEQRAQEQRERQELLARQQAEREAQRRVDEEKKRLRELCIQRYGRIDC